jgi:hypothetical protein
LAALRSIAAALCIVALGGPAPAAVSHAPGKACERTRQARFSFSGRPPPGLVTTQVTGSSCRRATVIVTVTDAAHRPLWREQTPLSLIASDRFPDEPGSKADIPFELVIGTVETWALPEPVETAPDWPAGAPSLPHTASQPSQDPLTQYETHLDRQTYRRIRAAGGQMLCIAQGPETAHCIALDPASGRAVELMVRGV